MKPSASLIILCAALALPASARAQDIPSEVGECVQTSIEEIGNRLVGVPDSGDAVMYANGVFGVSYDEVPGLRASSAGDPVELCLVSLPEDCPPGDERGKIYSATNLRNDESWELPDAAHMCGGA